MLHELHIKFLEELGWTIECESPLEIRHEDGSFATNSAAQLVLRNVQWPTIYQSWYHPDLDLQCSYVDSNNRQVVKFADNERDDYRPRVGDLYVEHGCWYGRIEDNGFRVLATGRLIECDNSKWVVEDRIGE